jgi:hypothetical protein
MAPRPDLRLDADEQAAFIRDVLASGASVPFATRGADGYPEVGLCGLREEEDQLRLMSPEPADGNEACLILEAGATYADITAVIVRGVVAERALALDDVVSFAFAKTGPGEK